MRTDFVRTQPEKFQLASTEAKPENSRMILYPDELRKRIKEAMEAAGIDVAELSRRANRRPDYFRDFLNGRKSSIKLGELAKLDSILGLEEGSLGYFSGTPTGVISENKKSIRTGPHSYTVLSDQKMFIYPTSDLGAGIIEVHSDDPIDIVQRPWFLQYESEGFGVLVNGQSMSPAFDSGSVAMINTSLPPARNSYVLLTSGKREGEFRATLRRLIDWNDHGWRVQQLQDGSEDKLPRSDWPEALRVVGRFDG